MRIVKLQSENIKRLTAVAVEPGAGGLVIVGGLNGQGKSSVLDSIAYALGGMDLVPAEPIRTGEAEAKIVVDLGDVVVTRKFKREKIEIPPTTHDEPKRDTWGPTASTLVVTNKDGAHYPSPQAMLNKLLGRLTFDPLAFARNAKDEPKKAATTLRQLAGLDFTLHDTARKTVADERTTVKKSLTAQQAQLDALPQHEGVPAEEIGADAVQAELQKAEELRKVATEAKAAHETALRNVESLSASLSNTKENIVSLQTQLEELLQTRNRKQSNLTACEESVLALGSAAITATNAVPDVTAINQRLTDIATNNTKVRANAARAEKADHVKGLETSLAALEEKIAGLDGAKATALTNASYPVAGLGATDEGVTWEGLPFEQAATSVQLRASVAIGLALNPRLKVLLVRNGNLLDDNGVQTLAELAEGADAQVWMEYVTGNDEGVTVMIEDGHVRA